MDNLFSQAAPLLVFLLPGFLSTWVYYGLTSHTKPTQFERTVEALVFTFAVHAATLFVGLGLRWVGTWVAIAPWNTDAHTLWSALLAIGLGAGAALAVNRDTVHSWLRRRGITTRTSHPSEWFCVLRTSPAFVVLQLQDGRRITGWPTEWPAGPSSGQFYLQKPAWIGEDGSVWDLAPLDGILIHATDVRWIEVFSNKAEGNDFST